MKKYSLRTLMVMVLLSGVSGCGASMSREELLKGMQDGDAPLIVDVRSQTEYDRDHLPGAIHIPFYAVGAGLREKKAVKDSALVIYCEHGPRAAIASVFLYLSGYHKIYSLQGHMKAWREKQYPVEIVQTPI